MQTKTKTIQKLDKRRTSSIDDSNSDPSPTDKSSNHLTNESSGIIRNRIKRFAQPRIIRVRASSSASQKSSSLSSISYDSATLTGSGIETTTKKRRVKGLRFDSATIPGSKMKLINAIVKKKTNKKFSFFFHFAFCTFVDC